MTFSDPIIQEFKLHLDSLYADPTLVPNDELLIKFEDKLRYDDHLKNDPSVLIYLSGSLLQIINSNNTTGECKEYAISFLDILLPYYTFTQVTTVFDEALLLRAINDHRLKRIIIKLLIRADVEFLANGELFKCLFRILADPNEPIAVVQLTERAIVAIVMKGDLFRFKILNDYDIIHILNDMKHNQVVHSRLIDLVCQILPVIPTLPVSLYLVDEVQLSQINDLLFYTFCIDTWKRLLLLIRDHENLSFLKNEMKSQLDFCSRAFIGGETLLDESELLVDYSDFGTVQCLTRLSMVAPGMFAQFDDKYHLVEYAMDKYRVYTKSVFFLTGVNTIFLRKDSYERFFHDFQLDNRTVHLFCHLVMDGVLLAKYFDKVSFPQSNFEKLIFDDLFTIFQVFASSENLICKMVNDWPIIITKIINTTINNDVFIKSEIIESSLKSIVQSSVTLGNLEESILEKLESLKGNVLITVEEPLTEHI